MLKVRCSITIERGSVISAEFQILFHMAWKPADNDFQHRWSKAIVNQNLFDNMQNNGNGFTKSTWDLGAKPSVIEAS